MTSGRGLSRRNVLGIGAAVSSAGVLPMAVGSAPAAAAVGTDEDVGGQRLAFFGDHQPGIETVPQAQATLVGLDLHDGQGPADVQRLLRIWTDDAARLVDGSGALADNEVELSHLPANLTVTFGFGWSFFDRLGLQHRRPDALVRYPELPNDRLDPAWSDGDLLVHVASDDPLTTSHAARVLVRDARTFARPRWVQRGFRRAVGVADASAPRNLMGFVDGTVNPQPGTADFANVVWAADGPDWFVGGTTLALRRIEMNLSAWERFDRSGRELILGRRLADGAPLTGGSETTAPDLTATNDLGLPVIPDDAHIALAHARNPRERFLRRGWNYDDTMNTGSSAGAGLLFCAYQADMGRQLLPVQRRLAGRDPLNRWTSAVGSSVFAIPPGCSEGSTIGEGLLS